MLRRPGFKLFTCWCINVGLSRCYIDPVLNYLRVVVFQYRTGEQPAGDSSHAATKSTHKCSRTSRGYLVSRTLSSRLHSRLQLCGKSWIDPSLWTHWAMFCSSFNLTWNISMKINTNNDRSSDRSFIVDPLSYFSFQPVLHDWCNKGRGMCYPVCGMVHIKEPLLSIEE